MKFLLLFITLCLSDIALAAKILKNNTGSPVLITDTGVTVPASGQYTILTTEDFVFAASNDVIILISDQSVSPSVSTLTVNDGTDDLGIAEGTSLIQGFFPKRVQIIGDDELHNVDIELLDGKKKMHVLATIQISTTNLIGKDSNPDSWCRVDVSGAIGDTVRIQIPDDSCDVTSTATATEAGDPIAFINLLVSDFNADGTCNALYKALRVKDNPVIHISAFKIDGIAERPDSGDFSCVSTGTTTVTTGFDNLISRQKLVKIIPDPDDPRVGATNVTGNVIQIPGGITDVMVFELDNSLSSMDMRINCDPYIAGTCDFKISCNPTKDRFISLFRVFGGCSGIQFGQHICKNSNLTNGIIITINSVGKTLTLPIIKSTEDWKNKFSFGIAGPNGHFRLDIVSGSDQFTAEWNFPTPALIRKCGTLPGPDDSINIKLQDDFSGPSGGNLDEFASLVVGFER